MNILAFETSSRLGSVALQHGARVAVREILEPRDQTEQILVHIDSLLAESGLKLAALDGVAFGRGPGSFTGLRVSAAVAQGLAAATGVALLPLSSLVCLAERAWREFGESRCLVCVDAHMGEVYWAETLRRDGVVELVGAERLDPPGDVPVPAGEWVAVGNGFAAHVEALAVVARRAKRLLPELTPDARDLLVAAQRDLVAGRTVAPEDALPVYLRDQTAWRRSS
jgi:tRNA threonylcarbamoyladenosine biosynthesis protein TsaB